jgi:phosphate transport system substrate-binding protein
MKPCLSNMKNSLITTSLTVLLLVLAVCVHAPAAEQKIAIKGSNTFGEELAPRLIDAYRKDHPDVKFDLETKGSGSGFDALVAGECDIASASRTASEEELRLARSRGIKIRDVIVGYYGVAVIANAANPLKGLSDKQVRDIFTGKIVNWKEVGGSDAPIRLFIRDQASGTYLGFQELAMERNPYAPTAQTRTSYGEIIQAVQADVSAIGYSSMAAAEQKGIKALLINGIQPTMQSVYDSEYPYARTLRLCTNPNNESLATKDFLRFVRSGKGQQIVRDAGFVRVFEQPSLPSPEL